MTVIGYKTLKRRQVALSAASPPSEMALQIARALECFGGEAHRAQIVDYIVACHRDAASPQDLRHAILACFEREAGDPFRDGVMFGPRFGPGSHRWKRGPLSLPPAAARREAAL